MGEGGKVARTVPVSEWGCGSGVARRLSEDASPYRDWNGRGGKVARTVPVSEGGDWISGGQAAKRGRFGALESERAQEGESPSVAELPARN